MKLVCIKSGKCIKEGKGFIDVETGAEGTITSKQRAGDIVAYVNGTSVLIPVDHLNHVVEKSFLACFKVLKESTIQESNLNNKSMVKVLIEKLENLAGKKVILQEKKDKNVQ